MGKQKILPKALRRQLNRLGQTRRPSPPNNRRKKITPELQDYLKELQNRETSRKIIRDFRELAHYAYVFDIEYYKAQLEPEEARKRMPTVQMAISTPKLKTMNLGKISSPNNEMATGKAK